MAKYTILLAMLVILVGIIAAVPTKSEISDSTTEIIAMCGAGLDETLVNELDKKFRLFGKKSSERYRRAVRAEFLNHPSLSDEARLAAYEKYLDCVDRQIERERQYCLSDCQSQYDLSARFGSIDDCMQWKQAGCRVSCEQTYKLPATECATNYCRMDREENRSDWLNKCNILISADESSRRAKLQQCRINCR